MDNNQSDIWKGIDSVNIQVSSGKLNFNRRNLKKFFHCHKRDEISKETFLDFFNKDSLSKEDEETGCYLSHLLFLDGSYNYYKVLPFVFDFVSPHELNKDGQLYIESAFQSHMWLSEIEYSDLLLDAINLYDIDLTRHTDNQGNNILHWIVTGNAVVYTKKLFEFFEKYLYYEKNNYGTSLRIMRALAYQLENIYGDYTFNMFGNLISFSYKGEPRTNYQSWCDHERRHQIFPNYVYSQEDIVMQKFFTNGQWLYIHKWVPTIDEFEKDSFNKYKSRR